MITKDFTDVKPGDKVLRMLAGVIPMWLTVTSVDDKLIHAQLWDFDRKTGFEEDPEIGYGVAFGITGSYLTEVEPLR